MSNKFKFIIMALILMLIISVGAISLVSCGSKSESGYASGSGTEQDPYIIMTKEQLIGLADKVNKGNNYSSAKYFALGADVDLGGMEWTPIGYDYVDNSNPKYPKSSFNKAFQGNFDGRGHIISNFKITQNLYVDGVEQLFRCFGFFGYAYNSIIENLGITKFTIVAISENVIFAGGLVGEADNGHSVENAITNCFASGNIFTVSNGYAYVGGLVGSNSSTITNCYAISDISAEVAGGSWTFCVGGLVGRNDYIINDSYAIGNVCATSIYSDIDTYAGGLVGTDMGFAIINNSSNTINNSFSVGNVSAISTKNSRSSSAFAGGFVGDVYEDLSIISNCYCFDGQKFYIKEDLDEYDTASNNLGEPCTLEQLNSKDFYISTLGWNSDVWDFTNLDFANGIYPTLK